MAVSETRGKRAAKPDGARAAPRRAATGESGKIQSLMRAAAILDAVARQPEGISLAQLAGAVGLNTSTAFHLVQTLVNLGFLTQLDDRRYRIGSRLFTLAAGALDQNAMLAAATPILERLSAETGYASHLAVRSKAEIVVIARTAATGLLQLAGHPGATRPAHATAIGKMLLAAMPPDDCEKLIGTLPLPPFTPNTITDAAALAREIETVRQEGIAHDRSELDPDVRCIAMPVHDFAGRSVAAIGLSGPVWRLTPEVVEDVVRRLRAAAAELSGKLGAIGRE
jgi:IclR family acetate operon transcriptional repressor